MIGKGRKSRIPILNAIERQIEKLKDRTRYDSTIHLRRKGRKRSPKKVRWY